MQTQLVREGMNNYFVINDIVTELSDYEENLLRYEKLPYFMPCEPRRINGNTSLYYKLTYRTNIEQAMDSIRLTSEKINNIMRSIVRVLEVCEEYLLVPEDIVWDADKVFIDIDTGRLMFAYCHTECKEKHSLKELVMEIIKNQDRRNEKSSVRFLQFYNLLTESEIGIDRLNAFIDGEVIKKESEMPDISYNEPFVITTYAENNKEEKNNKAGEEKRKNNSDKINAKSRTSIGSDINKTSVSEKHDNIIRLVKGLMAATAVVDIVLLAGLIFNVLTYEKTGYLFIGMAVFIILIIIYMHFEPEESADEIMQQFVRDNQYLIENSDDNRMIKDAIPEIDGRTVLLSGNSDEKMTVAVEDSPGKLCLVPIDTGKYKRIYVESESVVVGSMVGGDNFVLPGRGVSRLHAKLFDKNDGLYILDMNSTNGTFLNGEMLEAGKEYKLEDGDLVSFAGVQFNVCFEN